MKVDTVKRFLGAVVVAGALVTGIAASTDSKPIRTEKILVASPTFLYGVIGP
jgi:hypothetical protein